MNTNNTLKKQLEEEQDCLNFIKLWFKGMWSANAITWIISILLLTKLHIDFLIIPSILLTGGITLSSIYMLAQSSKIKHNIKKLSHKLYIEETSILLDNQKNLTKNHSKNNNQYAYTSNKNDCYKKTTYLIPENKKNYKPKKRVLTKSKKFKEK